MDWLGLAALSLLFTAVWIACYCASAVSRRKQAEKAGEKPKLTGCRIFYIVTWAAAQVFYWNMCITLRDWQGMN